MGHVARLAKTAFIILSVLAGPALSLASPAFAQAATQGYVVVGEGGAQTVRAITAAPVCPTLKIDGRSTVMHVRARPGVLPLRPTASVPALSKPSDFPDLVCEAALPQTIRSATLDGRPLPLAPKVIHRIVLIGDTGCRLKVADKAYQACNDPARFPFASIAASAAAFHPDLVIHVGDYLYRENPCPADDAGCVGSPWGYGQDAWEADFFTPAAPLLRAVPLALVRGNHETCVRAGQGWWRLLDPRPLQPHRDCVAAADDDVGDYSPPYAIPLDADTQLVIWDSANAGSKPVGPDDPKAQHYAATQMAIEALVKGKPHTFLANHHPLLAFAAKQKAGEPVRLDPGNQMLQSVFARAEPKLFPTGVDLLLNGHVHVEEQLSFANGYPSELVTGFSGTQEDIVPLPATLPPGTTPAEGAVVESFSSWVDGFGFATLEKTGLTAWRIRVFDKIGQQVNICTLKGRISHCDLAQVKR